MRVSFRLWNCCGLGDCTICYVVTRNIDSSPKLRRNLSTHEPDTLGVSWGRFLPYMVHLRQSHFCYGKWCVTKDQRSSDFPKEEWTSRPPFMTSLVQQNTPWNTYAILFVSCGVARRTFHRKRYRNRVQGLNHKTTV